MDAADAAIGSGKKMPNTEPVKEFVQHIVLLPRNRDIPFCDSLIAAPGWPWAQGQRASVMDKRLIRTSFCE